MEELIIDLNNYISDKDTALVGRENGRKIFMSIEKSLRFTLAEAESKYSKILITIPKRIVTMNKSFFMGFFETRIFDLGKVDFVSKYHIQATNYIMNKIDSYIDAALLAASMEDILNV